MALFSPVRRRLVWVPTLTDWLDMKELDRAIAAVRQGRYERVVTTGGPIEGWSELSVSSNYADLAASYLETHGLEIFP